MNNSESDSYNKNDMQKKVNVLVRLQEAMQEKSKTASYSEPIQIFTLVPDKWSRMHFSEYFNIFEYLHMKSKKYVTANPAPKNGKAISTELNVFEDDNFGRYVLEMKDYVSVSKGAHKQKLCNLQKSSNLQEFYTAFRE